MSLAIETLLAVSRGKGSSGVPYLTQNKEMLGIPVYSMYRADSTKNASTIHFKKNVKTYDKSSVNDFYITAAKYLYANVIKPNKIETILVPYSSSPIVSEVAAKIASLDSRLKVVQDSFKKSSADEIQIDSSVPGYTPQIGKLIQSAIEKGRTTGHFELKNISPPQFRKYVKGFMKMQTSVETRFITGKNVLVLDDILTKGTTIVQCAKNINSLAPMSLTAATIFKFS